MEIAKSLGEVQRLRDPLLPTWQYRRKRSTKERWTYDSRHIAWLIHKTCKISAECAAILDLGDLLKGELKNDNVQAFDTKWMKS